MDNNTLWFLVWGMILSAVSFVLFLLIRSDEIQTIAFINNGYTKEMLPGSGIAQWVKKYPKEI